MVDRADTARRHRPRSLAVTLVGVVLLLIGVGTLGWVGYQYFGTNVVARNTFRGGEEELRSRWEQGRAADDFSDVPVGSTIALLRIPRFGADYEVPIVKGTDPATLEKGVGWYENTAAPGQIGNFAIAGHRITHGEPFAKLPELRKGDEVIVETREATYTYLMDVAPAEITVNDQEGGWVLDPVPGKPGEKPTEALITLTTCQDLFHSPDRSVGFGQLAATTNK